MPRSLLLVMTGLALPGTAAAGGVGLITNAGMHAARAYYYDETGEQGIDNQQRFNYGIGGVAVLGDRDDRVQGVMRMYFMQDQPLADPDTGDVENAVYPDESSLGWRNYGVMTAGIQWGLFGDPGDKQLTLETHVGSGFASPDALEFLLIEAGPGGTWNLSDDMQLYGNLAVTMRYRKRPYIAENLYVGVRYLFD